MSSLRYRAIPPEDFDQLARNDARSFGGEPGETLAWLSARPWFEPRGLFDGGRLVSQLLCARLRVTTGTSDQPCAGVAGVATAPEERRRGHTGRLLRELCDELIGQGIFLSLLYPSRASFYRRFGWAICSERRVYSGPPLCFQPFARLRGRFEPVGPDSVDELNAIYTQALRGRFGPIVRSADWWRQHVLSGWRQRFDGYIWRDERGQGRSYVIYRLVEKEGKWALRCRDIVALDPAARTQLFRFIADHETQIAEASFPAPPDAPVNLLFEDPLTCVVEPGPMLRLLDVAGALGAYRPPGDISGRLTVAVADDWLHHNGGVYELEAAGGALSCRRLPGGAEADLACDVRVLTQIFSRYLRPRTAATFGVLEARSRPALALAERIFGGLAPFSADYF